MNLAQLLLCPSIRIRPAGETALSVSVANMLRQATLEKRYRGVWTKIANEGKRSPQTGAKYKAMGMIPGAPDFVFLWAGGGGLIELKQQHLTKSGIPSKALSTGLTANQQAFRDWCNAAGVSHATCRTVAEVERTLTLWGAMK